MWLLKLFLACKCHPSCLKCFGSFKVLKASDEWWLRPSGERLLITQAGHLSHQDSCFSSTSCAYSSQCFRPRISARGWCVKGGIMGVGAGDFWGDTGGTHWLVGLPSACVWPGSLEAQHAWRSMEGSWRMLGLCVCWWALPDGLPWWLSC